MSAGTLPSEPRSIAVRLDVGGMTCAACQAHVQKALTRVPGVLDASVLLVSNEARVRIDPARVGADELVRAVEDAGYEARVPPVGRSALAEEDARAERDEREYRALRRDAFVALAASVLVALVSLPLMGASVHQGPTDPVMAWLHASTLPACSQLTCRSFSRLGIVSWGLR